MYTVSIVIAILVIANTSALPIQFSTNNYYDQIVKANEPVKIERQPKNIVGKSEEAGYYKIIGGDAEGEKGFEEGVYSNGEKGYKELDTFHKELGDQYGFEEHFEFGQDKEEETEKSHHNEKTNDAEGAGTSVEGYYTGGGDGEYSSGEGSNYNEQYSSGEGGEGAYSQSSSYSNNSKDGHRSSSGEYHY